MICSLCTAVLCSVISLLLFLIVYSPLKKRGDWSQNVSRNNNYCFWDHYLGCVSQLLANSFSLCPVTVQKSLQKLTHLPLFSQQSGLLFFAFLASFFSFWWASFWREKFSGKLLESYNLMKES